MENRLQLFDEDYFCGLGSHISTCFPWWLPDFSHFGYLSFQFDAILLVFWSLLWDTGNQVNMCVLSVFLPIPSIWTPHTYYNCSLSLREFHVEDMMFITCSVIRDSLEASSEFELWTRTFKLNKSPRILAKNIHSGGAHGMCTVGCAWSGLSLMFSGFLIYCLDFPQLSWGLMNSWAFWDEEECHCIRHRWR